jgi:hypothetical protein
VLAVKDSDAATANTTGYIVSWTGTAGYEYYVYYEIMSPLGVITPADTSSGVKGQTLYSFRVTTNDTDPVPSTPYYVKTTDNTDKTTWAIAISATVASCVTGDQETTAGTKGKALWDTLSAVKTDEKFRVGIVAGNPGGYPIEEKRTVVYSDWQDGITP